MNRNTASGGTASVSEVACAKDFNESLVHQVVVAYMAAGRQGSKAQKSRSEVSGGGRKPWRQKGTGRARAGTIRSPLWRGGGVTFAARPRNYGQKVNRKMWRGAMRAIVAELARQGRLVVLPEFSVDTARTKAFVSKARELELTSAQIVTDGIDHNLHLAARNVPGFDVIDSDAVNPVALIGAEKVVMTVDALKRLEGMLQ